MTNLLIATNNNIRLTIYCRSSVKSIRFQCRQLFCYHMHSDDLFVFRKVQRHQQHRVPNSEPPAASAFTHIASIREADRHRTKGDRHCRKCHHWRTSVVTPIIARAFSLLRVLQLDTKKTKEIKDHRRCRRRRRQRRHHHLHRCSSSSSSSSSSLRLRHLCLESLL